MTIVPLRPRASSRDGLIMVSDTLTLARVLMMAALAAATTEHAEVIKRRVVRRADARDRAMLEEHGLRGLVRVLLVDPPFSAQALSDEGRGWECLEACYLLAGEAELTDLATGERHLLGPGSMYALEQHDRHTLRVRTDLHLVCVFNPALTGGETHDADGSFPPPSD
jgi:hypothetical protein